MFTFARHEFLCDKGINSGRNSRKREIQEKYQKSRKFWDENTRYDK